MKVAGLVRTWLQLKLAEGTSVPEHPVALGGNLYAKDRPSHARRQAAGAAQATSLPPSLPAASRAPGPNALGALAQLSTNTFQGVDVSSPSTLVRAIPQYSLSTRMRCSKLRLPWCRSVSDDSSSVQDKAEDVEFVVIGGTGSYQLLGNLSNMGTERRSNRRLFSKNRGDVLRVLSWHSFVFRVFRVDSHCALRTCALRYTCSQAT